jgi:Tol biopolymer transport system component/DNA-binding winged helix-turn-helix (wHTH) protein
MYDLLLVLIQNPNRIVEKDFLLKSVWPDSFVEEGNITFNIRQLRKALGDNVQDPIYIETIPRRGYRFVAEVTNLAPDDETDVEVCEDEGRVSHETSWLTSRPTLAISTFVLLAAVMGSALWLSRGNRVQGAPILSAPFASEKLSTDGQVTHAVITPDGKTVVYSHRSGKKQSLWLRQLDTSNNIQIIPPSEAFFGGLAVSPDGNSVYITRGTQAPGARQLDVYRLPIVGGVPQKLIDETQGWISISPDGEKISYVRCYYKYDEFCSLWVADAADGKNERKLVSRPRPLRIADNKISPDGRKVAFAVGQSWTGSNEFSFMEADIETGAEREITPQRFFNINYIASLPDQSGWLISALKLPDKNYRIWKVSDATGDVSMLTADSETYSRLSLDAKGRLLVSTRIEPDFKLNLYQTDEPDAAPKVLADGASVAFAPDKKIFYSTRMSGDSEVWSINPDGTDQRQLTNDPADDFGSIVSPDNRSVFFSSNRSGQLHVWRMAPDGTNQTQVTTQEGGFPLRLSPDGQWLYYRSGLNGTLRRVSIADSKEELVLSPPPRVDFALAPDTARVALTRRENNEYTFSIVSLADNQVEKSFKPAVPATRPAYVIWSHDGNDLVYVLEDPNSENRTLWFQGMDDNKPRKIADLGNTDIFELSGFALSYDAKSFVVAQGTWNHNAVLIKGLRP